VSGRWVPENTNGSVWAYMEIIMPLYKILALSAPFTLPIAILGLMRLMWGLAGAEWSDPGFAAFASLLLGFSLGMLVVDDIFNRNK